ncbi:MBL fold metallo-hydrolase [Rhodococcoides trifolii]|uniref:MBL fold metallo-hydrolase n=1 Tax=Rhodococcoides trifolii TaxID=908250 RepID=A0A917D0N4_9NOCA|nr:MBL fold metallo-hydrolase [Rhodococcus trifolii]GGG05637.1 MBL fold metallo-hydrolase [Rhodococcus trifolii]
MTALDVVTAADGVHLATGQDANWILLTDGDGVTLVDTGYPRYVGAVLESLRRIGRRPEDVRAILLTHAHIDHIGGAAHFASTYGTPVLTSDTEARHARREYLEQTPPSVLLSHVATRGMIPWSLRIVRAGALQRGAVGDADGFDAVTGVDPDGPLDLPGSPTPIASPGHTSGHTAYLLRDTGVLISGDALVTAHALSRDVGPQLLPPMFAHDAPAEFAVLDVFADLAVDTLLPGHGPMHRGEIGAAVARAQDLRDA